MTDREFDIVVVGGGIAGLSAGLTAARQGLTTMIVTGDTLGGHLLTIDRIDGLPGFADDIAGYDYGPIAQEQAMEAGAELEMSAITSLESSGDGWIVTTEGGKIAASAVILATGTSLKALGVPGEAEMRGRGVSHCASCDAPLMRDKPVVVAGGGDSALQEALTLAEHCSSVTIVHHGEAYSAQAAYRTVVADNAKISALPNSEIVAINGDEAVTNVTIRHTGSGETSDLECVGVFVFVGLAPNSDYIGDLAETDDAGRIVTDARLQTHSPGLFAAGTVRAGCAGRAAASAGDGTSAALAAAAWLATR